MTSTTGKIDLTDATGSLTIDGVALSANSFAGEGAAIDLSGAISLIFAGANTLDAGNGYVLLPEQSAITGTPIITGTTCFNTSFTLTPDNSLSGLLQW